MKKIAIKDFYIGDDSPLCLISGPCVIESLDLCLHTAEQLKSLSEKLQINFIFKSSYDKANRSSIDSYRGPGLEEGLRILEEVKQRFNLPITTDVHSPEEAAAAGEVCDMLQIPAFLCRQTDLLLAAANTGKAVNIKKGQFMAPWDMNNVLEKAYSSGNKNVFLTDRGVSFGYNNLVSDMRAIPVMQGFGVPVCFDATHSVQLPGGLGATSGGQREFIATLTYAAIAAGANCLFMEAHPNPDEALSDAGSQVKISDIEEILEKANSIYKVLHR